MLDRNSPVLHRHSPSERLRRICLFILLTIASGRPAGSAQEPLLAALTEIRSSTLAAEIDFEILVSGGFKFSLMELTTPPRLVVDLYPVENRIPVSQVPVGTFGVIGYRVSQYQPRTARVVFDLGEGKPPYRVKQTPEGMRVVFLKPESPPPDAAPTPVPKPPAQPPPPAAPSPGRVPSTLFGVSVLTYRLTDERFLEVFESRTGWSVGLEWLQVFAPRSRVRPALGVDYARQSKSGFSTVTRTPTSLTLDPVTVWGYLVVEGRPVAPYLGAGVSFYHYKEASTLHNSQGRATGLSLQAGVFLHLGRLDFLKLKLFGRWTKASVLVNGISADLGGIALGLTALLGFNVL